MIDFDRYDCDASELHDEGDEEPCEFCRGRGSLAVEPDSSLRYPCPDCN